MVFNAKKTIFLLIIIFFTSLAVIVLPKIIPFTDVNNLMILRTKQIPFTKLTFNQQQPIRVWTYWSGTSSILANLCLDQITKSCMAAKKYTFQHVHLTEANLEQYLPKINTYACSQQTPTLKSDMIRLNLLTKYGGIWLDATIFPVVPMDQIFSSTYNPYVFTAYFNPLNSDSYEYPVIETSALSCPSGHPLITEWFQTMKGIENSCSPQKRRELCNQLQLKPQLRHMRKDYHFVYYMLQKVLHKNGKNIFHFPNVVLHNVLKCNALSGFSFQPFFLFVLWSGTAFKKFHKQKFSNPNFTMIKFISIERKFIDYYFAKYPEVIEKSIFKQVQL